MVVLNLTYSNPAQFTTKGVCPEMANLTTQTFYFNPNKVRFNWDSTGQYVLLVFYYE